MAKSNYKLEEHLNDWVKSQFEKLGYQIPNKALDEREIRPDSSVGKLFSTYLKTHHPEFENSYKFYNHLFPDGNEFEARQYENIVLPAFIHYVDNHWIPERAENYFKKRDPLALEYLPKLLG